MMNTSASSCLALNSAWNLQKTPGSFSYWQAQLRIFLLWEIRRQRTLKNESGVSWPAPDLCALFLCDVIPNLCWPRKFQWSLLTHNGFHEESGKKSQQQGYCASQYQEAGGRGFCWKQDLRKLTNPVGPAQWQHWQWASQRAWMKYGASHLDFVSTVTFK